MPTAAEATVSLLVPAAVTVRELRALRQSEPEDEGRVRLGAFMSQLQNLNATISKLDRDANEGKQATYYRISELSYNSPVRVVLEPQALPKHPYVGNAIIENLVHITHSLQNGVDLAGFDAELLEDIRGLARAVGRTVASVTLLFNDHRFDFTPRVTSNVEAALAVDEECEGTIEGMLEQINLHHGANVFHIYPDVGPRKLTCHFPAKLYDDAVSAIGRKVEVSGTLHYRSGASIPIKFKSRTSRLSRRRVNCRIGTTYAEWCPTPPGS